MTSTVLRRLTLVCLVLGLSGAVVLGQSETVYITKTGAKYHRETCSSLSRSKKLLRGTL